MKVRRALAVSGVLAAVALLAAIVVSFFGDRFAGARDLAEPELAPEVIARGAYLARLGDCAACHSVPGIPAFSGGLRMNTPIGAIYTTNITPDPEHGIGRFTLADFDRALRFGVARGHTLYPAMPYTSYYSTRPEDVAALFVYFRYGVEPSAVPNHRNDVPFPLSMRWPLTFWRWVNAPAPRPFVSPAGLSADEARGAYFVEGLGHCGECHTPRTFTMALAARTAADGAGFLSGARVDNYFAPSLRRDGPGTLEDWSVEEIARFLLTGANARGIAFASMGDVITHSTQHMTAADARAAAIYLHTLAGSDTAGRRRFVYDETEHAALKRGDASKRGAKVYLDNCAACHRPDGLGYARVFPRLAGNDVVEASDPQSVIAIILQGSRTPRTASAPAQFSMPAFAWRLSDQEIADVASFVRTSWGNRAKVTTVESVSRARKIDQ